MSVIIKTYNQGGSLLMVIPKEIVRACSIQEGDYLLVTQNESYCMNGAEEPDKIFDVCSVSMEKRKLKEVIK